MVTRVRSAVALAALVAALAGCGGGGGSGAPVDTGSQQGATGIVAPLADPKAAPADEAVPPAQAVPRYLAVQSSVDDYAADGGLVASLPQLVVVDGARSHVAALVVAGAAAQFTTVRDVRTQPAAPAMLGLAAAFYVQAGRVFRLDLTQGSALAPVAISTLASACAVESATALDPNGTRALLQVQMPDAGGRCAWDNPAILLPSDTAPDAAPPSTDTALRLLAPLATSAGVATALLVAEPVDAGHERLAVFDTGLQRIAAVPGAATVATGADRWLTPLRHTTHAALVQQGATIQRLDWLGTRATLGASLYASAGADASAVSDAHAAWIASGGQLLRYDPGRASIAPFGTQGGSRLGQSADELYVTQSTFTTSSQTAVLAIAKSDATATDLVDWSASCCSSGGFSEYLHRGGALVEILPDAAGDAWGGYLYVDGGDAAQPAWAQVANAGAVFAAQQTALDTRTLQATISCDEGLLDPLAVKCRPGDLVQTNADGSRVTLGTLASDHARLAPPFDLRLGVPTLAVADVSSHADVVLAGGGTRHVKPVVVLVPGVAGSLAAVDWLAP